MGYALAEAASEAGWVVELVSGPVGIEVPVGVAVERVETGAQMQDAMHRRFEACDVLIMTAAIMDYRPKECAPVKIKKDQLQMVIEMEPVVDVLASLSLLRKHQLLVGFAAETNNLEDYALQKLDRKGIDYIVANRIGVKGGGFESDRNEVLLLGKDGTRQPMGPDLKGVLARRLIRFFEDKISVD